MKDVDDDWWCVGCDLPVVLDGKFTIIDGDDETQMPDVIIQGQRVRLQA
jgi:hypothetical protein